MRVTVFKTLFAAFIPRAGAYLGFFKGGGRGGSHYVMPRVLIRLVCQHLRHVILKVTFFWMSSESGGRDKPTKQLHRLLSSMLHKLLYFSNEQEHVPLQMLGPVNGVRNYLALEKIYCMLILWIRVFWPPELQGHKTIISQRGGGGHGHPRVTPLANPCRGGQLKIQQKFPPSSCNIQKDMYAHCTQ